MLHTLFKFRPKLQERDWDRVTGVKVGYSHCYILGACRPLYTGAVSPSVYWGRVALCILGACRPLYTGAVSPSVYWGHVALCILGACRPLYTGGVSPSVYPM